MEADVAWLGPWLGQRAFPHPPPTAQVWPGRLGAALEGSRRRGPSSLGDEGLGMSATRMRTLPCTFSLLPGPAPHPQAPPTSPGQGRGLCPRPHPPPPPAPIWAASPWQQRPQAWHRPNAEDAGGADRHCRPPHRPSAAGQQTHLAHVAGRAAAHPHLGVGSGSCSRSGLRMRTRGRAPRTGGR